MATIEEKLAELKARQEAEQVKLIREEKLRALLPTLSGVTEKEVSIYAHKDNVRVRVGDNFRQTRSLADALAILEAFGAPTEAEHRESGTLSIRPFELYSSKELDSHMLRTVSVVGIQVDKSGGEPATQLEAWFRIGEEWCEVEIPFDYRKGLRNIVPSDRRDERGRKIGPLWFGIGEDFVVNWWSPEGSYRKVYYWHNFEAFEAWKAQRAANADT